LRLRSPNDRSSRNCRKIWRSLAAGATAGDGARGGADGAGVARAGALAAGVEYFLSAAFSFLILKP